MTKKVKKVIIKDEPLVATTLAIKEDKKKASMFGIIWIILIFGIFIAGVIYLPDLSSYVNNLLNPDITNTGTASNNNKDNTKDKMKEKCNDILKEFSEEKIAFYDFEFFITNEDGNYKMIGYKNKKSKEISYVSDEIVKEVKEDEQEKE